MKRCSIILVLLMLAGCSAEEAGKFTVHFGWQDGVEPDFEEVPLFLWASVQVWPDGDSGQASTVAEAGPVRFGSGQSLEFSDLTYGDHRVVVAEVRGSDVETDPVRFFGRSEIFSIEPGMDKDVEVELLLGPAPGYDPQGLPVDADIRFIIDDQEVSVTTDPLVGLRLHLVGADHVTVANDSGFSVGVATLPVSDLIDLDKDQYDWPSAWNLNQGLEPALQDLDGLRTVFVKSSNQFGHTSPTSHASVTLDRTAPQVLLATLLRTPIFAEAIDDQNNEVYFGPLDPFTGIQVQANVLVYADEPFVVTRLWAAHQSSGAEIDFTLDSQGQQSATYVWTVSTQAPEGVYDLWIDWSDLLGNRAQSMLAPRMRLMHTASPDSGVIDLELVHYTRTPFGSQATDGSQNYSVRGRSGSIQEGDNQAVHVMAYSRPGEPDPANLIGYDLDPAEDGSFIIEELSGGDLPLVWIAGVDRYGLVAAPEPMINSEWVVTMGNKIPGSTVPNPLVYEVTSGFSPTLVQRPDLTREPDDTSELTITDGAGLGSLGTDFWSELATTDHNPVPVFRHAAVYDATRGNMLLFGGLILTEQYYEALSDRTWQWDPARMSWADISPDGNNPLPTGDHAMAYDRRRDRVMLYGGNPGTDQLWEFDPDRRTWTRLEPAGDEPPGRNSHGVVHDSKRGQLIVMFGENPQDLDDIWIWTPSAGPGPGSWETVARGDPWPAARTKPGLVYDRGRDRVVLFGGLVDGQPSPELWEWDPESRTWTPHELQGAVAGVIPDNLETFKLAYDSSRQTVLLLGGFCDRSAGDNCLDPTHHDDTLWEWNPASGLFELLSTIDFDEDDTTPFRRDPQLVFDETRLELLVFGGEDNVEPPVEYQRGTNELWAWSVVDRLWIDRTRSGEHPQARWYQSMGMDNSGKLVLFGGIIPPYANLTETWTWDALSGRWEQLQLASQPGGDRQHHSMVYAPVVDRFYLFGGQYSVLDPLPTDLWEFDPTLETWNPVAVVGNAPVSRGRTTLVYDQEFGKVLLFAGEDNSYNALQDTWEWDPVQSEWLERLPAASPEARNFMAAAWAGGRVVVFGGKREDDSDLQDLWLWDSTDGAWTMIPETSPWPPAGPAYQFTYDRIWNRLILSDGAEVWELDPQTWAWREIETSGEAPGARLHHSLFYDESGDRVMLFGGFGPVHRSDLWSLQRGLPAHLLEVPIYQAHMPEGAQVDRLQVVLVAGGSATLEPSSQPVVGADLLLWLDGTWQSKAVNQAPPEDPQELRLLIEDPVILAQLPFREELSIYLAVTPATGGQLENLDSNLVVDYAEVTVGYRL